MNKIILFYPSFLINKEEKTLYTDLPLSVIALASKLYNHYDVEIIDERIDTYEDKEIMDKLDDVFMVGISATTSYQIINGLNFAKKVREYDPNIKIVWGGWHASLMPQNTIEHELVDIIIIGQGEYILSELAKSIKNNESLENIPNLYYKSRDGSIVKTHELIHSRCQIPDTMKNGYKCVDVERYIHKGWGNNRLLGYESSRGCPYSCRFCSISSIYHQKWFKLGYKEIYQDIHWLKEKYQIDAVHFFDNNFFVDKKRALQLANEFNNNKLNIRWDGTIVIKQFLSLSRKEIELLKKSGFYRIIVGIESGDNEVLENINKQHTNEQVLELVKRCKEYGLLPSLSFMVGFPWNPDKDTKNTIELIQKIKNLYHETEILLFIFSPYLGTPLYEISKTYGMKFPDSLEGWAKFTYDKANTPWVSNKLEKKINRYLGFFGTKEMSAKEQQFYLGFE